MKLKIRYLGTILVLSQVLGCDIEDDYQDGPDASSYKEALQPSLGANSLEEEVPEMGTSLIRGGTESAHSGIVQISTSIGLCTGFLLNERTIVTAAHCLPAHGAIGGSVTVANISRYENGASNPTSVWNGNVIFQRHPEFVEGSYPFWYPEHDVGYIYNYMQDWPETNYENYLRIYQDYASRIGTIRMWGRGYSTHSGHGSGTLRYHDFPLSGWPSYTYEVLWTEGTDDYNYCKGDSGGPVVKMASGLELVAGVNSGLETWGSDVCSSGDTLGIGGGDQSAARINGDNLTWIMSQTFSSCTLLNANSYNYKRCFEIPYINTIPEEGLTQDLTAAIVGVAIL